MKNQDREASLEELRTNSKTTILLISLKCGSLGLNLTAASRVVLLDIWWNPQIEEQAIDRVHRIGQQHPVEVYRIMVQKTIEDRINELSEEKVDASYSLLQCLLAA